MVRRWCSHGHSEEQLEATESSEEDGETARVSQCNGDLKTEKMG